MKNGKKHICSKPKFTKEKVEKLIRDLFDYYGNPPYIREKDYVSYLENKKGLTREEITVLLSDASWEYELINIGMTNTDGEIEEIIWRPEEDEFTMKELQQLFDRNKAQKKREK